MALKRLTKDLNIIQKLDDEPNDVGGMTAEELKAAFDTAGNEIKTFINDSLLPELEAGGVTSIVQTGDPSKLKYVRIGQDKELETSPDGKNWEAIRSTGHIIQDGGGNALPQRARLQFSNLSVVDSGGVTKIAASNPNLLLNWYFRRPVNQNGQTEYSRNVITIDCWKNNYTTNLVELLENGVRWTNTRPETASDGGSTFFHQAFDVPLPPGTYTLSALVTDVTGTCFLYPGSGGSATWGSVSAVPGLIQKTFVVLADQNATRVQMTMRVGGSVTLEAIKLERGPIQTLARQLEDGTWEIIDPPNYDLQYALTGLYSPITGDFVGSQHSNPNLLDNAYWADIDSIIDQRNGYVVPPETPYYSDTALGTQAGTVTAYTTATYVNGTYGTVTVDSTTYYIAWSATVRGYARQGYAMDRWTIYGSGTSVVLSETGILASATGVGSSSTALNQHLELSPERISGKIFTLSILVDGKLYSGTGEIPASLPETLTTIINVITPFGYLRLNARTTRAVFGIIFYGNNSVDVRFEGAKLELGPIQTLAHQDSDGSWVLNDPPPNRALELVKCQRYYQLFSSASARPTALIDYRPAMRINPALGTINVGGQTMYYADANL